MERSSGAFAAVALVGGEAEEIVVLKTPAHLFAIGQWYEDFEQVEDADVRALLDRLRHTPQTASGTHE